MPKLVSDKAYLPFTKGLITEVSPLAYPEGATLDEDNIIITRAGGRERRLGLRLDSDGVWVTPIGSYNSCATKSSVCTIADCTNLLNSTNFALDSCGSAYWVGSRVETLDTMIQLNDNIIVRSIAYANLNVTLYFNSPTDGTSALDYEMVVNGTGITHLGVLPTGLTQYTFNIPILIPDVSNNLTSYIYYQNNTSIVWGIKKICVS